jgi:hypothetical protein
LLVCVAANFDSEIVGFVGHFGSLVKT